MRSPRAAPRPTRSPSSARSCSISIRRGEIDLDELPEVRELVAHLDELDAGAQEEDAPPPRPIRKRFDPPRGAAREDDGTVAASSRRAAGAPATAKKPAPARVWRPPLDADERPATDAARRAIPGKGKGGKGGITFDDDDLADYMHPDDVPPKGSDGDA